MVKTVQRVLSVVVTLAIIVVGIAFLGHLVRPVNTDIAIDAIDTFHNMPDNSFEVIGYGSSHMWRGMNPIELYNQYGIGAYNYGCNWQKLNTTLLFLKDSLRTQSPKVVLIETYLVDDYKNDQNVDGEIYYTTAIDEFDGKREYLKQALGNDKERYLAYYMPLCAFHDNWIDISKKSFEAAVNNDFYKTMGFVSSEKVTPVVIPEKNTFNQNSLSDESIAILDEIVEICDEANIDIIFYTTPWQGDYNYSKAMEEYVLDKNNCVYIDLYEKIEEIGLDGTTDFSDEGHLNTSGSNKVADYLGEYLIGHYELTDFRDYENNIWIEAQK